MRPGSFPLPGSQNALLLVVVNTASCTITHRNYCGKEAITAPPHVCSTLIAQGAGGHANVCQTVED